MILFGLYNRKETFLILCIDHHFCSYFISMQSQIIGKIRILSGEKNIGSNYFVKSFEDRSNELKYLFTTVFIKK